MSDGCLVSWVNTTTLTKFGFCPSNDLLYMVKVPSQICSKELPVSLSAYCVDIWKKKIYRLDQIFIVGLINIRIALLVTATCSLENQDLTVTTQQFC